MINSNSAMNLDLFRELERRQKVVDSLRRILAVLQLHLPLEKNFGLYRHPDILSAECRRSGNLSSLLEWNTDHPIRSEVG